MRRQSVETEIFRRSEMILSQLPEQRKPAAASRWLTAQALRMLQPDLPLYVTDKVLGSAARSSAHPHGFWRHLGRLAQPAIAHPSVTLSPNFTVVSQTLRETARQFHPQLDIYLSAVRFIGTLLTNGEYVFTEEEPIISTAVGLHGQPPDVFYTWTPRLPREGHEQVTVVTSASHHEFLTAVINPEASNAENMLAIIEAADDI